MCFPICMNRGTITAEEDVRANFAENATIEAGNAIFIDDVALHSKLRAGRLLAVEGKRGLIAGGYVAAGKEIRAKTIGNQAYISRSCSSSARGLPKRRALLTAPASSQTMRVFPLKMKELDME